MGDWVKCSNRLPKPDTPVLVFNDKYPAIQAAMRIWVDGETEDESGYAWAFLASYCGDLSDLESYEFDDDYHFTHWHSLPMFPSPGDERLDPYRGCND